MGSEVGHGCDLGWAIGVASTGGSMYLSQHAILYLIIIIIIINNNS